MRSPAGENPPTPLPQTPPALLEAGTPAYRRATMGIFVGGFATFATLYGTQPILPLLHDVFGVSAATASLTVSAGTAALALLLIPASVLSDRIGRVRVMQVSLLLAGLISLASAFVTDFNQLLVLRTLLGAALAGMPAAAMAYLGEEIAPTSQGRAMGLYIAGNALGGMSGRLLSALFTEWVSWRFALGALGVIGCLAALLFWMRLPASRHFRPRAARLGRIWQDTRTIYADPGMPWLFLTAFLLMGAFVGLYNFLGFRLMAAPFNLSQAAVGAIFILYLVGTWGSTTGGKLADRHGRRNILWIMVAVMGAGLAATLANSLAVVIGGVAVFTFGFFAAHSVASGWVGRRALERRGLAAALYLCSYYFGASVLGSLSGLAWTNYQWPGVAAVLAASVLITFAFSTVMLRRLPPKSMADN